MFDRGVPSICYGLRGLVYFQIDLRGTKSDLHSGSFGGAVANPAMVLAQILAQMKDRGGRIKIPGFYDDVRRAAATEERRAVEAAAVQREDVREGARRAEAVRRDAATRRSSASWARPTFEVNGLLGGFTGEGAKTVIPAVVDGEGQHAARARPGSGQDRGAVRGLREEDRAEDRRAEGHAHARRQAVDDRRSTTRSCRPPAARSRRASARRRCSTARADRFRSSSTFQEDLGLPSVLFGVGLPDENAHAPNEKLDLGNFHGGIIASAYLYDEIAKTRSA